MPEVKKTTYLEADSAERVYGRKLIWVDEKGHSFSSLSALTSRAVTIPDQRLADFTKNLAMVLARERTLQRQGCNLEPMVFNPQLTITDLASKQKSQLSFKRSNKQLMVRATGAFSSSSRGAEVLLLSDWTLWQALYHDLQSCLCVSANDRPSLAQLLAAEEDYQNRGQIKNSSSLRQQFYAPRPLVRN